MSKWERVLSPRDTGYGKGWCNDLDRGYKLGKQYVVLTRLINTEWGIVEHVFIRNKDNTDISWSEKQKIKNDLFGKNKTAIEVFPKEERLIDAVGAYHLWVLPENMELPFGLHPNDTKTEPIRRELMLVKKN